MMLIMMRLRSGLLKLRGCSMNILFLMGCNSDKNKEDYPLYLTEVKGKTILEKQIESA